MTILFGADAADIEAFRKEHLNRLKEDTEQEERQYGNIAGRLHPNGWRERIKFDFTDCPHTQSTLVELKDDDGKITWGLLVCDACGTAHEKECPHERTEWLFDGKLLVCLTCGVDCT